MENQRRTKKYNSAHCFTASSLEEAIHMVDDKDIYIAGGAKIYEQAIHMVDKMYITEIDLKMMGDTYFPEFEEKDFERKVELQVEGEIPYTYITYTKKINGR